MLNSNLNMADNQVYVSNVYDFEDEDLVMEFRLYYDGLLRSTQRRSESGQKDKLSTHKHKIRQCFHRQLKEHWRNNLNLRSATKRQKGKEPVPMDEWVATQHNQFGYSFVPLVRNEWGVMCSLDILLLRRDMSRSVMGAGDLDNRVKTLIDGLSMPSAQNQLTDDDAKPNSDESIFYSLLEDDYLISDLKVRSDALLSGWSDNDLKKHPEMEDPAFVKAIIDVKIKSLDSPTFWGAFMGSAEDYELDFEF